ncbi:ABC-type bacteriocin/lantibiotic exporter, contains an N-terminal double-glycine peptidase domain [Nocardioides exalbidus]|uniref:ABC-type bacteriocin/lantibiotic exporter, contains an N-terminal double-glycine peptidase domain n=1 Tax=Nocardioides exalbidus TaxID=402596 RepID=A0A1H4LAG6_9ACTN|nr:ABC-type bacteriocin/lantibiotic exporter, contains an N-terminal double-glycine peptidase domain [Nocardioides exalbidus]
MFDRLTTRRFSLALAGSIVISLVEVLATLMVIPLMQLITQTESGVLDKIRHVLGDPADDTLAIVLAAAVGIGFIGRSVLSLAIRWWTIGFVSRRMVDLSAELMRYYLHAPYSMHVQRGSADLLRRVNDSVNNVFGMVLVPAVGVVTDAVTVAGMTVALLVAAPLPTLVAVLIFGLGGYLLQRYSKRRVMHASWAITDANLISMRYALQSFGGIKEIKLRNEQEIFVDGFADAKMASAMQGRIITFLSDFPKYATETLFVIGIGAMTSVLFAQQSSGHALAVLALFAVAGFRVMPGSVRIVASLNTIRSGGPALDLIEDDIRAMRATPPARVVARDPMPLRKELRLESVSFRYDDSTTDVLTECSLNVPAGSSLALVGGSGAGKSTLVDLILGLQTPASGAITADGEDTVAGRTGWQAGLAVVPQDVFLLDGSLRDNITFSPDGQASDDKLMEEVVASAQLADLVAELPEGLETHVGERGTRLSGGQRQRVGIARALYRDPQLLVLDEATSALDNATEHRISDTVRGLHGDTTLVIVAHRLSTVRHCDQIALLSSGRVAATGTFDELRATNQEFARLVELGTL